MIRLMKIRSITPVLLGLCLGLSFSFFSLIPVGMETFQACVLVPGIILSAEDLDKRVEAAPVVVNDTRNVTFATVSPKTSRFNYDYRPYFVYSELSYRSEVVVAVVTTEARLRDFGFAVNNTWLTSLSRVVFFTAYSKDVGFHERYNRKLNLNVVQLPDVDQDSSTTVELTTRVIRYLKEHYYENYNWFTIVKDNSYINSVNLLAYLGTLDRSKDLFVGHPQKFKDVLSEFDAQSDSVLHDKAGKMLCNLDYGIIFSRSAIFKFVLNLETCVKSSEQLSVDEVIGYCVVKAIGSGCHGPPKDYTLYHRAPSLIGDSLDAQLKSAMVVGLIKSPGSLIKLHHLLATQSLDESVSSISRHQECIKEMIPALPDGVPEKTLHWPIGFNPPFKPQTRFEVIQWSYFTEDKMYGHTVVEPMSDLSPSDKLDISEVMQSSVSILKTEYSDNQGVEFKLVDGYRRIDPQRGTEYILDLGVKDTDGLSQVRRVHLLRPLTKVETLHMPAATEQRGIHLVLPVLREDTARFEQFLQMYKRVCLQTGENVVLLTVFVNIRPNGIDTSQNDDTFRLSKNLIARYKQSYMWAQLPWLQVGVKQSAVTLVMDIVSMKLPSNALIFVVSLGVEFTINFLNRCRVNVVNGAQVYFPIPFSEFDPDLIFKRSQRPTFLDVHRDHGIWDRSSSDLGCFSNKDYKDLRMLKEDFLSENHTSNLTLLGVFQASKLSVFRGLDQELHRKYHPHICRQPRGTPEYRECMHYAGERLGSRGQIARYLFEKLGNNTLF